MDMLHSGLTRFLPDLCGDLRGCEINLANDFSLLPLQGRYSPKIRELLSAIGYTAYHRNASSFKMVLRSG